MENPLPVVGCAAPYEDLRDLRPWLLEKQRDLELQNPSQPEFLDGEWSSIVAEIRSLLDGYTGRLGIHGPFRGMTIDAADPLIASAVITRLRQGIEFGQAIGATQMVMHSPFLFFGKGHLPHSPEHGLAREIDAVRSLLDQPLKEAQAAGITLVVENIFDINPRAVNTLVREINHPCLRRSIDTGHAHLTHQRGGPTADAWVSATGELLEHIHLADNDGELDRHWNPGEGDINWFAFWRALAKLEQKPRLILEVKRGRILEAAQWLSAQGYCA